MIQGYAAVDERLVRVADPLDGAQDVIWLDLADPTEAEETAVEERLGIDVPTREEMEEIEDSSRLYVDEGSLFMTATLLSAVATGYSERGPVTFILTGRKLVTLRYHEPSMFRTFPARAEKSGLGCVDGESVLLALLDAIVDRLADILEKVGHDLELVSRGLFRREITAKGSRDYTHVLREIGRLGDLASNVLDSLISVERILVFIAPANGAVKESKGRLKTLSRDIRFLTEHASFLSQKVTFLLDATLGMIGIEQNATIKIFSVAAVVFLPPTLIASIYGMNFGVMPELHWPWGYPFAIGLMIASALVSFWVFKKRGWL
ncbi:magnesium transporter CorA family protein [Amaricoccus sp.]|uniref:magnesium transporter CorA family protein n=1 Tax=Amaricoccus sp. TaxID=1872485 RepID=UPI002618C21E|nr:magnesium transporter CorA family protein [uncultured Amaricoccus sp.]